MKRVVGLVAPLIGFMAVVSSFVQGQELRLNDKDYLEARGLNVLVYQNSFHPVFGDQKLGGLEIILHGERIATGGDVRLLPTPEQWDVIPHFIQRKRGAAPNGLTAFC